MTEAEKKLPAAYVPFATFKSAIEQLGKGMHSKVDRSVFAGYAWNIQNQLFGSLKFLGLINSEFDPTPTLEDLVLGNESERKDKLKQVLEQRYFDLFAMGLTKTTPHQLDSKMSEAYGVTGDTRVKAVRFFLSAADYVGIPLSPLFKRSKSGKPSVPRKKRLSRKSDAPSGSVHATASEVIRESSHPGTSKSVKLKSGGMLTLSATLDLFVLNAPDRKFVFDLIDKLEEYEKASA